MYGVTRVLWNLRDGIHSSRTVIMVSSPVLRCTPLGSGVTLAVILSSSLSARCLGVSCPWEGLIAWILNSGVLASAGDPIMKKLIKQFSEMCFRMGTAREFVVMGLLFRLYRTRIRTTAWTNSADKAMLWIKTGRRGFIETLIIFYLLIADNGPTTARPRTTTSAATPQGEATNRTSCSSSIVYLFEILRLVGVVAANTRFLSLGPWFKSFARGPFSGTKSHF